MTWVISTAINGNLFFYIYFLKCEVVPVQILFDFTGFSIVFPKYYNIISIYDRYSYMVVTGIPIVKLQVTRNYKISKYDD